MKQRSYEDTVSKDSNSLGHHDVASDAPSAWSSTREVGGGKKRHTCSQVQPLPPRLSCPQSPAPDPETYLQLWLARLFPSYLSLEVQIVPRFRSFQPLSTLVRGLSKLLSFPGFSGILLCYGLELKGFIFQQSIKKCELRDVLQDTVMMPGGTWLSEYSCYCH